MKDKLYYIFGWGNHIGVDQDRYTKQIYSINEKEYYGFSSEIAMKTGFLPENIHIVTTNDVVNTVLQIPKTILNKNDAPYRNNKELYDTLDKILLDLSVGNRVFVVGHSLGGAFVNHLAQKINSIFSGKNIKIRKRATLKSVNMSIRKNMESYKTIASSLSVESLQNLHMASFGTVWVWKNQKSIIPKTLKRMQSSHSLRQSSHSLRQSSHSLSGKQSIKLHNYVSVSDISNFCIGDVCKNKKNKKIDNDKLFDGLFVDEPKNDWKFDNAHALTSHTIFVDPTNICSCQFEDETSHAVLKTKFITSRVIPICLYDKNKPVCNYTKWKHGMGEHNYYDDLIYTLLRNRDLDIYDYKTLNYDAKLIKKEISVERENSFSPLHESQK
jgi:hypothetical protein